MKYEFTPFLLDLIRNVGAYIVESAQSHFEVHQKTSRNNLVTAVDMAAEKMITDAIQEAYPSHGFIGEEYGMTREKAEYQWIIDPIDGTTNFANGLPLYCTSIALAHHGAVILGAIYNPVSKELFYAEKAGGAYLNGKTIQVSQNASVDSAFLVTGFPYDAPKDIDITKVFAHMIYKGLPVRRLGSAALDLAYVACGRFDAFWEYNLNPWDIAAGYLIVQEAGGAVTNFNNEPGHYNHKETLASNGVIHEAFREELLMAIQASKY